MKILNILLSGLFLLFETTTGYCASDASFLTLKKDSLHKRNGERVFFPAIFYKPETRFGIGFGEMVSFKFDRNDSITRPCKAIASQWITQNKQLILTIIPQIYTPGNKYFIYTNCQFWRFPNRFYNIGCNSSDNYESYSADIFELKNIVQRKVGKKMFLGIIQKLKNFDLRETESGGILSKRILTGSTGGIASGAGFIVNYDTRDNIFYPYYGSYNQLQYINYSPVTGSKYNFNNYLMDLRKFIRTWRYQVIALQFTMEVNGGNTPFFQMAQVGGSNSLRGYYLGRFTDNNAMIFQTEYRVPVWKRFGIVGFGGAGEVADRFSHYNISCLKPSGGAGLRFKISEKEKVNARLDYGWGKNYSGLYVEISEAF